MDTLRSNDNSTSVAGIFQHYDNIRAAVMIRDYTLESPQSRFVGDSSSLYSLRPYPVEDSPGRWPSGQTHTMSSGQDNGPKHVVETDGRGLIARAVGSQPTEQKGERIDDQEGPGDNEKLSKQREYRAKIDKVLPLLPVEQEQSARKKEQGLLLRERRERDKRTHQEREENARRARVRAKALSKLQGFPGEAREEEFEALADKRRGDHGPSMTSSESALSHIGGSGRDLWEEMRALMANFQREEEKIWREIKQRYKSHDPNQLQSFPSTSLPTLLINSQLRGDEDEILRRQEKRQQRLEKCAKAFDEWLRTLEVLELEDIQKKESSSKGKAPEPSRF